MSSFTAHQRGKLGEEFVCQQLHKDGWRILGRNYRCPYAEIDILALDPARNLVVIEVKTRSSFSWLDGYDCVSSKQLRRLSKACLYIGSQNYRKRPARLDLALVKCQFSNITTWQHLTDLDLID